MYCARQVVIGVSWELWGIRDLATKLWIAQGVEY